MLVTGGNDRIPGFVTDPADHLVAYKEASGSYQFAVVVESGDHGLIASTTPEAGAARQLAVAFLKAELVRHPASNSLLSRNPPAGVQLLLRGDAIARPSFKLSVLHFGRTSAFPPLRTLGLSVSPYAEDKWTQGS
jgi:hypothetical protein